MSPSRSKKKTDNAHLGWKRDLRRLAVRGIERPAVLDLFAGFNTLWMGFDLSRYYGVEMVKGKGRNLCADNLRVIPSLDLSGFDVIDCDSYGSSVKQIDALFANPTLRPGTVILFTEIHSPMSCVPSVLLERYDGLPGMHSRIPTLINPYGWDLFEDHLHGLGIESWTGYEVVEHSYVKHYGFFRVPEPRPIQECKSSRVRRTSGHMASTIYTPAGRAREYSPLALNLYLSCTHGCRYCYAPHAIQRSQQDFFKAPSPRTTVIDDLKRYLDTHEVKDQVLLSFVGDPYCESLDDGMATRRALELLLEHGVPVAVLTKGGSRCLCDIDLFERFGDSIMVGATLTFDDESLSREWEPGASTPTDRLHALRVLHDNGIRTFASFEPVIDPIESLRVMRRSLDMDCIDLYKIGKLNGMPSIERTVDWTAFLQSALSMLRPRGKEVYVKADLRASAPSVVLSEAECDADLHTVSAGRPPVSPRQTTLFRRD